MVNGDARSGGESDDLAVKCGRDNAGLAERDVVRSALHRAESAARKRRSGQLGGLVHEFSHRSDRYGSEAPA